MLTSLLDVNDLPIAIYLFVFFFSFSQIKTFGLNTDCHDYLETSVLLVCFINGNEHCAHVRIKNAIVVPISACSTLYKEPLIYNNNTNYDI